MRTEEAPFWVKHWKGRAKAAEAHLDAIRKPSAEMVKVVNRSINEALMENYGVNFIHADKRPLAKAALKAIAETWNG